MKRAIMILATAALASTLAIGAANAHGGGGGHGGFGGGGFGGGHAGFGGGAHFGGAGHEGGLVAVPGSEASISASTAMPQPAASASTRFTAMIATGPDMDSTAPIRIATIGTSCTPAGRCR
ncbi:hypothetical protein [Bradyrhizobium sp. 149]|uniref:hypothetical protein n=1 Tax=Bradyrhizobium sp. 149 TaxID=2782624 RepID=UPI001FFA9F61|nr:hypothetical protein [Bradyrhizobium sp. 149]